MKHLAEGVGFMFRFSIKYQCLEFKCKLKFKVKD